jgi:hypothetical protein
MKTDTREYDDGTEPDVYRRWCCDGLCKQGRLCPKLMPAEAATDLGQEEEPNFYSKEYIVKEVIDFVLGVVLIGLGVIVVAYLAGRFL